MIDPRIEAALARGSFGAGTTEPVAALATTLLGAARASERAEARASLRALALEGLTVRAAAPAVATALVAALPGARPDDRARLVDLLAELAYAELPAGDDDEARAARRTLTTALAATRRAVWAGEAALIALLPSDDEDLGVALPFALVALIDGAGEGAPAGASLDARARTLAVALATRARAPGTPAVHASLAFGLGRLAPRVPELAPALRSSLAHAPWPVRIASAIGVLRAVPRDEAATEVLLEALRRRAEHAAWFPERFPWFPGHLRFFLVALLSSERVADEAFARALPALAELLRAEASAPTFERDAVPPLRRALGAMVLTSETRRRDLPEAALVLMDALHGNPAVWAERGFGVGDALGALGVPSDVASWQRMLERR